MEEERDKALNQLTREKAARQLQDQINDDQFSRLSQQGFNSVRPSVPGSDRVRDVG